MTTSNSTTIYTGPTLKFYVDESNTVLKLVKGDGTQINVWGQTLKYAFAPQQSTLTLYFTPVSGTEPVSASYVDGQGTTVQCSQQGGSAMLVLQQPASIGFDFDIELEQDSTSSAAARLAPVSAGPAATARMAARPGPTATPSAQSGSLVAGARSPSPKPTGPGARLQTRLVLSTVEPPPDPDARRTPTSA